ncbi:Omega amidase [Lunatimonas lonarensis]|uniref:Omega-amidase YafV n=1 Tax=Lunatimonas lonarensis TaxID=1232681 RepID=R7ZUI8_9BACT|nr:amidohydrolase [Lunatimonas lonarensis]EON77644.1 Omega amidase [Lunatimonas lonarensis]
MKDLKLAAIQSDLYWHNKTANLSMFEEKIWQIGEQVDLIVLPEMFTTGFTMDVANMSEPMNLDACKWLKAMASQTKAVVTGSVIVREKDLFFNRLLWATPEGELTFYDKRHLFRMAGEDSHFSMGTEMPVFQVKGWNVLPQICYDLRFPVWSRNRVSQQGDFGYDLSLYIASWPGSRVQAWDILLKARAVENWCYTLGVNRVGVDGNGIAYLGHSAVYDFKGSTLGFVGTQEQTLLVTLDASSLLDYRDKFPAWKDADDFELKA